MDAGWTTLSESTMGTILRLVGRHLPLTTTRHLQKLTRMSGREVAAATEHSADFRIFREDAEHWTECCQSIGLIHQSTHLDLMSARYPGLANNIIINHFCGNDVQAV